MRPFAREDLDDDIAEMQKLVLRAWGLYLRHGSRRALLRWGRCGCYLVAWSCLRWLLFEFGRPPGNEPR